MMDMHKYIMQTLEGIGVPISYVARGESRLPLIVFNITNERGDMFWDDEERVIHWQVQINIFSTGNFVDLRNEIKNRMLKAGFIRKEITSAIYLEDIEVFNQPMAFDFYEEIKETSEDEE